MPQNLVLNPDASQAGLRPSLRRVGQPGPSRVLRGELMASIRFALLAVALAFPIASLAASPYADQMSRSIKALSDEDVADYLSGKGLGLAKAAELNGYPGPLHVLELSEQLALSPSQKQRTDAIFARMLDRAKVAGKLLVDEERKLDELFASRTISPSVLHQTLDSIATLQRQVREIHLQAHLEVAEVLNETQAMMYWHLRGYGGDAMEHSHRH